MAIRVKKREITKINMLSNEGVGDCEGGWGRGGGEALVSPKVSVCLLENYKTK